MKDVQFITVDRDVKFNPEKAWGGNLPFNSYALELADDGGLMLFMKEFSPSKPIKRATLKATALGVFELFLNGVRVGDEELKPFWTDYKHRVFEFEYDITAFVQRNNRLLAQVARGWYSGRISFGFYGYRQPAFGAKITLEYADGSTEELKSDESWLSCIGGRIRTADIWDGYYRDNTLPDETKNPDAYEWQPSKKYDAVSGLEVIPPIGEPLKVFPGLTRYPLSAVIHRGVDNDSSEMGKIHIISKKIGHGCEKTALKAGEAIILDLGQEIVGRPVFTVKAAAGTKIQCYIAELLNDSGESSRGNDGPKGSMYIKNYRSALARAVLIAGGEGEEACIPTHTYYGFRYMELRASADIEIVEAKGEVIGSALTPTGDIETDNSEVNQLISNIKWGMRGNYFSNPTDCPQRDERLGWTGDTQIFCGAASYFADIRGFMHKWLGEARCSQKGYDGTYCDVIPRVFEDAGGNAAWGDAGIIVPYRLWLMYNDTDILEEHWQSMEDYMAHVGKNGLNGEGLAYGDWLNYDVTDKLYIAVCYYAYSASLMAHFAELLSAKDEKYAARAVYYKDLFEKIRAHFIETQTEGGMLKQVTQTTCLLALRFGLVEGEMYDRVKAALEDKIVSNDYTLTTGFVGTGVLCQTLSQIGEDNLAYSLLLQTRDPSWLYSVRQGATTVWERWNSYTKERGFGDVGMNSFNHYAYGAVAEWMFEGMAGISPDPEKPGFKHFIYRPTPDTRTVLPDGQERIKRCRAHYDSTAGRIESEWSWENGEFYCVVTIPEGASATVKFPTVNSAEKLNINGVPFTPEELGGKVCCKCGRIVFELGAGTYRIS